MNNLKGLLTCLVVFGHFFQCPARGDEGILVAVSKTMVLTIYLFHMPLFVFISGYLSKNLEKRRNRAFFDLLLPYALGQLLVCLAQLASGKMPESITNFLMPEFGMWYLLALYFWRTLAPDLVKIKGIFFAAVVINLLGCYFTGIGNEMALQRGIGFLCFFLLGLFTQEKQLECLHRKLPRGCGFVAVLGVCCLMAGFVVWRNQYSSLLGLLLHRTYYSAFSRVWTGAAAYLAVLFATIVSSIAVMNCVPDMPSWLGEIGRNSLAVYLFHLPVYSFCRIWLDVWREEIRFAGAILLAVGCIFFFSRTFASEILRTFVKKMEQLITKEGTL